MNASPGEPGLLFRGVIVLCSGRFRRQVFARAAADSHFGDTHHCPLAHAGLCRCEWRLLTLRVLAELLLGNRRPAH